MRKRNKGRKLSMTIGPRKQLLKSLANSFFLREKIKTTEAKAKEVRPIVEKMITRAKTDTVPNRRILSKELTRTASNKVFGNLAPRYKEKNGGYTRIVKLGPRPSDGAKMVIIELVK